jgi:hypothetical protein
MSFEIAGIVPTLTSASRQSELEPSPWQSQRLLHKCESSASVRNPRLHHVVSARCRVRLGHGNAATSCCQMYPLCPGITVCEKCFIVSSPIDKTCIQFPE